MKALPAYEGKAKKKERALITKQITTLIDEATAVKKEAAVSRRDVLARVVGFQMRWWRAVSC